MLAGMVPTGTAFARGCTVPPELAKFGAPLPRLAAALAGEAKIRIVALGSSSTWGSGASSRTTTAYPARLEYELRGVWPSNDVRVFNAGIGGQLARQMLTRIDKDVAPRRPQLVIWQTGVNDAIRGVPIDQFKRQLDTGIEHLQALGSDVILIDQQFYPSFKKLKNGPLYMAAIRDAALKHDISVMQRFRIMQHLIASAQYTAATLLAPDQFHLNDNAYYCIGHLLAQSLRSATAATPASAGATEARVPVPVPSHQPVVKDLADEAQM